jgi:hypothetical protein
VARAAKLQDKLPAKDLWSGVAQRIGAQGSREAGVVALDQERARRRRFITLSVPQLAAAAVALIVISAATTLLLQQRPAQVGLPLADAITEAATAEAVLVGFDIAEYDTAVADLEQLLREAREQLDPETVRTLEQSLATIDRAISEAQRALQEDPANRYLSSHLAATMKRKIQLLQRARTIASAAS